MGSSSGARRCSPSRPRRPIGTSWPTRRATSSACSRRAERGSALGQDALLLEVVLEAFLAELPSDAAGLEAAERGDEVHRVLVHAEGAGADPTGDVHPDAGRVAGPHRAG